MVDVIELAFRALGTEVVDQVESRFADAAVEDEVFILGTNGSADSIAALTTHLLVAFNAITALALVVVDLSRGVALRAHVVNQVVSRKAAAGTNSNIPDFIDFAFSSADAVG